MRHSIAVALSALAVTAAAQDFTINPAAVPLSTRANWCVAEGNTCSTLCDGNPTANSCDPNTLNFTCSCQNNSAPGLQYYLQTMPTFICNEAYQECIEANVGSATGQSNCTTSIKDMCGQLNPDNYTAAAPSSSSAAPTATGKGASNTGSAAPNSPSSSPTATHSTNGVAPTALARVGTGAAAVAVGVFAYLL
ncbi:hypothetical protein SPI_02221 [Niveomyces insectorum RCEF 264]|uniref:DUF7707 domain-containing protein n=1 Tax=Niveomyces insectorum RCEF 264 TaxID=1081102 RepID=A0A167XUV1_9HYPO|nr:hypothetical protein SPI_02221 [Niveomyces insectorum RCEF 264]